MDELSGTQKFFKLFVSSATFADMEAESRMWKVKCPNCGNERSIWEMGGIRYKAAGNPRIYRPCPNCGQRTWQVITKSS